jgi:two-component system phosphate regulon sensor histidine kinase PhoR
VLVLHDVSDLRRLERARREFSSNVSHELKTPLTSIQAYADALLEGGLEDPGINRNFVERILQQTERLTRLIFDLLNLSKIEADATVFEREPIPLADVVREVLPDHHSVAEARGLVLHVEFPQSDTTVDADREGLRTILNNLIRNALSYTPRGGQVWVRVVRDGDHVRLEVQDTGVGIAREHHERIFERFYRVDKARSREMGGTGLGLSIVKHLVEEFGGSIALRSEAGEGSTFVAEWPLVASSAIPEVA